MKKCIFRTIILFSLLYILLAGCLFESPKNAPVASFRLSTYMTTINNPITLYDTSSGSPSSWSWTVKNSASTTVFISTSQNPTWTPTTADWYSVTLTATNSAGSNTLTKSNKYLIVGSGVAYNSSSNYITWLGDEYLCGNWQMSIGTYYDDRSLPHGRVQAGVSLVRI